MVHRLLELVKQGKVQLDRKAALLHLGFRGWFDIYYVWEHPRYGMYINKYQGQVLEPTDELPPVMKEMFKNLDEVSELFEEATTILTKLGFKRQRVSAFLVSTHEAMPKGNKRSPALFSPSTHSLIFQHVNLELTGSPASGLDLRTIIHEWAHTWLNNQPKAAKDYLKKWYVDNVLPEGVVKVPRGTKERAVGVLVSDLLSVQVNSSNMPAAFATIDKINDEYYQAFTFRVKSSTYNLASGVHLLHNMGVDTDSVTLSDEEQDRVNRIVAWLKDDDVLNFVLDKLFSGEVWTGAGYVPYYDQVLAEVYAGARLEDFLRSRDSLKDQWKKFVDLAVSGEISLELSHGYDASARDRKLRGMLMRAFDWGVPKDKLSTAAIGMGAKWRNELRQKLADKGIVPRSYAAVNHRELWSVIMEYVVTGLDQLSPELQQLFKVMTTEGYYEAVVPDRVANVLALGVRQ